MAAPVSRAETEVRVTAIPGMFSITALTSIRAVIEFGLGAMFDPFVPAVALQKELDMGFLSVACWVSQQETSDPFTSVVKKHLCTDSVAHCKFPSGANLQPRT